MQDLCDLKVQINGQHTFFLNQKIISAYSERLRRLIKQEKKKSHMKNPSIKIMDFPGGSDAFELVLRFCYNDGRLLMTPTNLPLLHCSAIDLEMTERASTCNLLRQTETFLDGLFYWTWNDILCSLKSCEPFIASADESGLLHKLVSSLLAKISANSEISFAGSTSFSAPSSSSSSSPDTSNNPQSSSSTKTHDPIKPSFGREWWFDDLTVLPPPIIERFLAALGAYGEDNKNLILTRFLLHYLKSAVQKTGSTRFDYGGLADTAVHGVVLMGRTAFSCRGLFWVLRTVSCLGLSKECRVKLERLMGLMLDMATLDDLLVSGGSSDGGVYDVNLVLRLVRVYVEASMDVGVCLPKMKKVGRLVDKYLGEISPDQGLKVSKFLAVAESLPDCARDCFDGVYRAVDIFLESHPTMSSEERTRLCRCLNYEKLTLEACKDLAKNPRIPPRIAMQALVSQQSKLQGRRAVIGQYHPKTPSSSRIAYSAVGETETEEASSSSSPPPPTESMPEEKEEMRLNFERMRWRVMELEKVCKEMKGQMSKMNKNKKVNKSTTSPSHHHHRGLRLC